MTKTITAALASAAALVLVATSPALAGKNDPPKRQVSDIPICQKKLGVIAIVEPETQWWRELELGSPEALIKYFVNKSKCFTLVDRGKGMAMRNIERAMADSGELRQGSQMGKGQVKAADFFLVPDLVGSNKNAGGTNIGGVLGGFMGGGFGALVGGINIKKKEANVLLTVVDARSTEQVAMAEGRAKKTNIGWGAGGGFFSGIGGAVGASSYSNTEIGQVITMAYLNAYYDLLVELGGNPIVPDTSASDEPPAASSKSASSAKSSGSASSLAATKSSSTQSVAASAASVDPSFRIMQAMDMRDKPSDKGKSLRNLPVGAIVKATGKKDGIWWEVADRGGTRGWVSADFLDEVK
jgi:Bacterial SH3 domain/Curli production assembly/transport component CsgG